MIFLCAKNPKSLLPKQIQYLSETFSSKDSVIEDDDSVFEISNFDDNLIAFANDLSGQEKTQDNQFLFF